MDVGTAKLTEAERRGVPHHLLDVWDVRARPTSPTTSGWRRQRSTTACARPARRCSSAGRGSTSGPPSTTSLPRHRPRGPRAARGRAGRGGPGALHARLADADPAAAARDPAQQRPPGGPRTGGRRDHRRPFTASLPEHGTRCPPSRSASTCRADAGRADRDPGRPDVGAGAGRGGPPAGGAGLREGRTASRALGYSQVLRHLDGECTEEQARDETVRATRRFARRQESWFRRDQRVRWLDAARPTCSSGRSPGRRPASGMSVLPDSW